MLENLWKMDENLIFGNTGFKTLFSKYISSHTHAFCSSILLGSKDLGIYVFRTLMCIVGKL